jgi:hypothetical protein
VTGGRQRENGAPVDAAVFERTSRCTLRVDWTSGSEIQGIVLPQKGVAHPGPSVPMGERTPLAMHSPHGGRPDVDPTMATYVGRWHLASPSAHRDECVVSAYRQLEVETDHLYSILVPDDGSGVVRVVFTRCRSPYASDRELIASVRAHGDLEVTSAAVGGGRLHPLLGCEFGGAFDRFRAIHDLIGHVWSGFGFDLAAEWAAWRIQDAFHTGLARLALATELCAVNAARAVVGEAPDLKALLVPPPLLANISNDPLSTMRSSGASEF